MSLFKTFFGAKESPKTGAAASVAFKSSQPLEDVFDTAEFFKLEKEGLPSGCESGFRYFIQGGERVFVASAKDAIKTAERTSAPTPIPSATQNVAPTQQDEAVQIQCPKCGKQLRFRLTNERARIRCPVCKNEFTYPTPKIDKYCPFQDCGWPATKGIYCDRHSSKEVRDQLNAEHDRLVAEAKAKAERSVKTSEHFSSNVKESPNADSKNAYVKRCDQQQHRSAPDSRTFASSSKFQSVLVPLNSTDYAEAIRAGTSLLSEFSDFDMLYCWLTNANRKNGHTDDAITIGTRGLQAAKRKHLLLDEVALAFFAKGDLLQAVYYWGQAIRDSGIKPDNANPYLYLSYVALASDPARGRSWSAAFLTRADSIYQLGARLDASTANRILQLTKVQGCPALTEVIARLVATL